MVPNSGSGISNTSSAQVRVSDGDEFPRSVAKTAVAQLCEAAGFHSIQLSALETLADIATRYLCDVGKVSQFYANMAGRTESNALDVVSALEDIGGGGLAELHGSMANSGTVKELKRFIEYGEEIPFCKPVPHFPVSKKRELTPSFAQIGEKPPDPHIPDWLPAFPDPHTYKATPVWNERKSDPRLDKLEQARQRRKAERSLVQLHLRLSSTGASTSTDIPSIGANGSSVPNGANPLENNGVLKHDIEGTQNKTKGNKRPLPVSNVQNPFLAPPLPADAKEVSSLPITFKGVAAKSTSPTPKSGPVALPSALEAFGPALEAAKHDVQDNSKTAGGLLPDLKERMPVLMTLDFGRKMKDKALAASLSLGGHDRKKMKFPSKYDEKDEKKRRVEQILSQTLDGDEDGMQS